jgi:hypothetical protein
MNAKQSASNLKLNGAYSGEEKEPSADTEIDWYDFGGGYLVVPGLPSEQARKQGGDLFVGEGNMACLCCVRSGLFYYKVLEGDFTEADLPELRKEWEPKFAEELNKKTKTQEKLC